MPSEDLRQRAAVLLARRSRLEDRWPVVVDHDLEALDQLTGSRPRSYEVLRDLRRADRMERVRRGLYLLRNDAGVIETDILGLVAAVTPDPYLVTAGRALELHDLTDQHFRTIRLLTPSARQTLEWRGEIVRYTVTDSDRIWGGRRTSGVMAATPERALLDSIAQPTWGVTLAQCVEALDGALERRATFSERLAVCAARYGNASAARRLGFLVEQLAGETAAAPFRSLIGTSKAMIPLDVASPPAGATDPRWRLRVNAEVQALLTHRQVW